MNRRSRQQGFSLTEALIATGILAIGLAMIAMAFPVGVRLASIATERPVGVVAANEAFAKIQLYSVENKNNVNINYQRDALDCGKLSTTSCMDLLALQQTATGLEDCFLETLEPGYMGAKTATIDNSSERFYPSQVPLPEERRYYWSPLFRRANTSTKDVQVTVFVCRMLGMGASYYDRDHILPTPGTNDDNLWPVPVKVQVNTTSVANEIEVIIPSPTIYSPANAEFNFFTEGCMIVEDSTGGIYKVLEKKDENPVDGLRETLVLDKDFTTTAATPYVWVVPPAIGSGRNPCIDVVQMTMGL